MPYADQNHRNFHKERLALDFDDPIPFYQINRIEGALSKPYFLPGQPHPLCQYDRIFSL
jgi:hypothetical protein